MRQRGLSPQLPTSPQELATIPSLPRFYQRGLNCSMEKNCNIGLIGWASKPHRFFLSLIGRCPTKLVKPIRGAVYLSELGSTRINFARPPSRPLPGHGKRRGERRGD